MANAIDRRFLERLQRLIGRDCSYLGRRCSVVDILWDEGALILQGREQLPPIQTDQYGQATSRSNELLQVPIFDKEGTAFSDEIMDLFSSLTQGAQNES